MKLLTGLVVAAALVLGSAPTAPAAGSQPVTTASPTDQVPGAVTAIEVKTARTGVNLTGGRLRGRLMAPGINRTPRAALVPDIELGDDEDLTDHGGFGRVLHTPATRPARSA